MKFRSVLALAALVVLAACSSNEKKKAMKPADLVDFDATTKIKKVWSRSVGDGMDKRLSRFLPAISTNAIYVSDVDGRVYSINKETGKREWKVKLKGRSLSAGVGHYGEMLYVGTYDGELIALSAVDGAELWSAKTSSEILAVPAANAEVVIAQTIDGRVFGFDAKTGASRWRYDHSVPSLTIRGLANPVMDRTQAFAAFGNGQVVSLNPSDGALLWSGRVSQPKGGNELEKIVDVDGSPLVSSGVVYAASYQGAIAAFSKAKGAVLWKQDMSTHYQLAESASKLIAVAEDSHIVAFNSSNGAIEWTNDALHRRDVRSPLVFDDYVIAIDKEDYLHVMSESDGGFAYRFKPSGDGFSAPPLAEGERFYLLSDDGRLSAYRMAK